MATFARHHLAMKLTELKVSLAKRILDSDDEDRLHTVDALLSDKGTFRLTDRQKAELDSDFADYKAGVGRNYTWAEVKAHARRSKGA